MASLTISSRELEKVAWIALDADIPVCVWGASGIGKSTIISQAINKFFDDAKADTPMFCKSIFAKNKVTNVFRTSTYDLRLAHTDTADWGIPVVNSEEMTHRKTKPSWLPSATSSDLFVLFVDELNRGTQEGINSMMSIAAERRLGEYTLPKNNRLISACNPPVGEFNTDTLDKAMKSRWAHVHYNLTTSEFLSQCSDIIDPAMAYILSTMTNPIENIQSGQLNGDWNIEKEISPCPRTIEMLNRLALWTLWARTSGIQITGETRSAVFALASGLVKPNIANKWLNILLNKDWVAKESFFNGAIQNKIESKDLDYYDSVLVFSEYKNLIPNLSSQELANTQYILQYAKEYPEFYNMLTQTKWQTDWEGNNLQ